MAVYEQTISLKDNVSGPAISAAKQMKILTASVTATQTALVKAQALGNVGQVKKLTKELGSLQGAMASLPKEAGGLQMELAEVTGGLSLVAEVAGGVALAFGAIVLAGAALAIEASTAKMQMLAMFDALGAGAITGERVDDMLDNMRSKLGVTKDAMVPLVKQFMAMGVTSEDALQKMTTAALSAKALTGGSEAAADAFTKLSKKIQLAAETGQGLKIPLKGLGSLASMGLTVDDVAKKMGVSASELAAQLKAGSVNAGKFGNALQDALIDKGAGPLQMMSLSVANLGGLVKEYLVDLFEDLGDSVKPFLLQVKQLFGIFDSKANPSGKALKSGIQAFFKEVFAIATRVVPMVKHFLLDCIIFGLKAYLAIKPIVKALTDAWKQHDGMGKLLAVWNLMKPALIVVGVAIGIVVAAVVLLGVVLLGIQAVIFGVGAAIVGFSAKAMQVLVDWALGAAKAAADFVSGLVNGITSGAGAVVDAVKGLASGAKNAFKGALGISSPSKVMMELGGHVAGGVAEGMSDGASDVHAASGALAGAATGGFAGGASGGGGKTITINVGGLTVHAPNAKDMNDISEAAFALLMERVALTQGAL